MGLGWGAARADLHRPRAMGRMAAAGRCVIMRGPGGLAGAARTRPALPTFEQPVRAVLPGADRRIETRARATGCNPTQQDDEKGFPRSCRRSSSARWPTTRCWSRPSSCCAPAARPSWQRAALVPMFALFYVVLAPSSAPSPIRCRKGRVMFIRTHQVVGCLMMLFGSHPLLAAYAVVGLGGGLFAGQVRHPDRAAAALAAGQGQRLDRGPDHRLDHPRRAAGRPAGRPAPGAWLLGFDFPMDRHRIDTRPRRPSPVIVFIYVLAALFNLFIRAPRRAAALTGNPRRCCATSRSAMRAVARQAGADLAGHHHAVLGRGGNLRYIVLAWAAVALGYTHDAGLQPAGWWPSGTAVGAVVASLHDALHRAVRDPAGHRAGAADWSCC